MLEWLKRGHPEDEDPDRRPRRRRRSRNYDFTDRTRKVFGLARQEAIALGHDYVGTEHLLLGLIREGEGVAVEVMRRTGVESAAVVDQINDCVRKGRALGRPGGELPYTSRAKRSIEYAMSAAADLDHAYVGTEHLLLGLLQEEKGVAAQVLNGFGLTMPLARRVTLELLGAAAPTVAPVGFGFRIDDGSSRSIHEQIISQVQEGVARGVLKPGDILPDASEVAAELSIAPGTVVRAYRELESDGVAATDRESVTRIAGANRQSTGRVQADTLIGLLRPGVLAAFHLGASAAEVRAALERAVKEVFDANGGEAH